MIYWFKRTKDGYIFPLEERAASQQYYSSSANNFTYLGRSSGDLFKEEWDRKPKEMAEMNVGNDVVKGVANVKENRDQYFFAFELELEDCYTRKDFTPPVDTRKMDKVNDLRLQAMLSQK